MKTVTGLSFILILLTNIACDSDPGATQATPASIEIASAVASRADYMLPEGQQTGINAVVKDESGQRIPGAEINWQSSNPAVLQVDNNGGLMAVASGNATISASSGSFEDSAMFTVYNLTGQWQNTPAPGAAIITLDLTQNGTGITGVFVNSAWTSSMNSDVGWGPLAGTLDWNLFTHSTDVANGCTWTLSATIKISDDESGLKLSANDSADPW